MNAKLYYIDTNSHGSSHEMFNAASLKSFSLISNKVKYFAHASSKQCVYKITENKLNNVHYTRIRFPKESNRYLLFFKLLITTFYNILFIISINKNSILVFNTNNIISLRPVNLFNKFFKRKIIIICHNELECIFELSNNGIKRKIIAQYFLNGNIKISNTIFYLVLGDSILNNLSAVIDSEKIKHFISIDHPLIIREKLYIDHKKRNEKYIRIGTVGVMAIKKGLNTLLFLDKNINKFPTIKLSITGKISEGLHLLNNSNIEFPNKNGEFLKREIIDERLINLDYILFLYPNNSYNATSSGALIDAISLNKPIISLSNSYFKYLFDKFGEFGYLVNNEDELLELFYKIEKGQILKKYNFDSIKNELTPESTAKKIEDIFHKIKFY